ncbi:MAG: dihydropteroate synthase [Pirellulaceae bacterium]|nr:dihydropteroate synthase [Pirellulaceae bacterium]
MPQSSSLVLPATLRTVNPIASTWKLRTTKLEFGAIPKLMGILNITPDSFSDGGVFFSTQSAIDRALQMEDDGADILDIGGESTRPFSEPVSVEDEISRILPVVAGLQGRLGIPISIDTTKSQVATAAVELGAEIINDISGLEFDPEMLAVAMRTQVGVCAMHMQGTPTTMQENPHYSDVVEEVRVYLSRRDRSLISNGIDPSRICLDPGIGFGKSHQHNLELLQRIDAFHALGRPLLVGHSRKGFIAKIIDDKQADRMPGSIGVSLAMAMKRIQILRIHDVLATKQALLLFQASGGLPRS